MSDDMSFLDADNFPDRPDHPDFWKVSKIILANDAAVTEDGKTVSEIAADFIDPNSLSYMAINRCGNIVNMARLPVELLPILAAVWTDAFVAGAMFGREGDGNEASQDQQNPPRVEG